ncbi:Uma2 family endonuclease [Siccirubricoccus sp. KC 17139]|uniref:Uma2 family endonuclease n=1 Tax=Siccirubricoccus soli TaxID=2899147 RepID=A0ABT1D4Y0_9PROT|nr:Uma2 family endonuclease [Siccirubricoccus soli]MCO6416982.1 Uma2 family endonuclease [Siccirubricoccus soli]MCP2683117.1 Uma2 family endonuclease [Siccirubricoccus soli]
MDGLLERAPWVKRHKLDVRDYHRMGEAGIFAEGTRVELIEGEIVDMAPIGSEHTGTVTSLTEAIYATIAGRATVAVQSPLRLSEFSEPEPDLLLLKPRADRYRSEHPTAADVLLLIEVANTSLRYDRDVKLPLYAKHGVPEVWIVNLTEGLIEVYRDPKDEAWLTTRRVMPGETVEPAALPGLRLAVDAVLG